MQRRIWLDVTDLLIWEGHATGIPRTLESIATAWLAESDGQIAFCLLNEQKNAFLKIEGAEFARRWNDQKTYARQKESSQANQKQKTLSQSPTIKEGTSSNNKEASGPLKRLADCFPIDLSARVYDLLGTSVHLTFSLTRFFSALAHYLFRTSVNPFLRLLKKPELISMERLEWIRRQNVKRDTSSLPHHRHTPLENADFQSGDVFFSAGGGWMRPGYTELLKELKSTHQIKCSTLVYDVIPVLFPHFFWEGFPPIFSEWLHSTLKTCDLIITISKNSERDIHQILEHHPEDRKPLTQVVRLGDSLLAEVKDPQKPKELLQSDRSFVLSVGTLEVRKNHALLYGVWRRLVRTHKEKLPLLVLVGRRGWLSSDLIYQMQHDPVTKDHVVVLDSVNDAELAWLYKHCQFTVYPSFYEGWGLPVAESLVCGKYCIASNAASLPEIPTKEGLIDFQDPHEVDAYAQKVAHALDHSGYVLDKESLIKTHYQPTKWEEASKEILNALLGLLANENGLKG